MKLICWLFLGTLAWGQAPEAHSKVVNCSGDVQAFPVESGESFNLKCGEKVTVLERGVLWTKFKSGKKEGLVASRFIEAEKTTTVQIVSSQQGSWQQNTQVAPGQPATAETNCTGIDPVNCKTVWHPATAPTVMTQNIHEVWVNAIIGERHVRLWCQKYFRDCRDPEAGSYTGEVKGDSVYLDAINLEGKKKRIKYKVVGSW